MTIGGGWSPAAPLLEPSRVLHCVPSMAGGGAERQLVYLAGALARQGWDVHVALNGGGPNLTALTATGATLHHLRCRGNHDPRMLGRLRRLIRMLQPDIVQCWLLQMEIAGGIAATLTRTPWILSERSSVEAYPFSIKHRLRVAVGALASAIIANSSAGGEYWQERIGPGIARYIVPNALPLDEIADAPVAPRLAPAKEGAALILFAGRFEESKGAETLVRALARLSPGVSFDAYFFGAGPRRAHIERLVAELGLASRAQIMGYADNLWSVMKRASVLVSPSQFEGSPNVVLEAMACGCPLVVSDIRGHREILDDRSAIFVSPLDVEALARSIEHAITDRTAARIRAAVASSRVARHATAVIAQQYVDVYHEILSRRGHHHRSTAAPASAQGGL